MRLWRVTVGSLTGMVGVSLGKDACPLGLGTSEARLSVDQIRVAQGPHFAGLRPGGAACSMWHLACTWTRRRIWRAQFGMFTQRLRGGWRDGFLLGAAWRGVAF